MAREIVTLNAPSRMIRFAVASEVRDRLIANGMPSEEAPAVSTIEDALKGMFR